MSWTFDESRRFERQARFAPMGVAGQERLSRARVLVVGCGALGGSIAQGLVRSGVGELCLVDRDVVEVTNLPRQVLFTTEDARLARPKVEAALSTLATIGGPTRLRGEVQHVDLDTLPDLAEGADLILDGTDNLATRYLLNDWSLEHGVPWIYGGVVGATGIVLLVVPGQSACLRCLFPEPPPPELLPTCESAGVILPAVSAVAAFQCALALRWLAGDASARASLVPYLVELDLWNQETRRVRAERHADCPACARGERRFLTPARREAVVLCGRNTVQVQPAARSEVDLSRLAESLGAGGVAVRALGPMLRFDAEGCRLTVFRDGRALVEGTDEPGRARAIYDRWVGS